MLQNLLNSEQLNELLQSLDLKKDFTISENGLTVKFTNTNGKITIEGCFNPVNLVKKELDDFTNYTESIPDDLFVEICEYLGETELRKIQECTSSSELETVRAGVLKFKQIVRSFIKCKIDFLTELAKI